MASVDRAAFVDPEAGGAGRPGRAASHRGGPDHLSAAGHRRHGGGARAHRRRAASSRWAGAAGTPAAVLVRLAGEVHRRDRPALARRRRDLDRAGAANVHLHQGDGPWAGPRPRPTTRLGRPERPRPLRLARAARAGGSPGDAVGGQADGQRLAPVAGRLTTGSWPRTCGCRYDLFPWRRPPEARRLGCEGRRRPPARKASRRAGPACSGVPAGRPQRRARRRSSFRGPRCSRLSWVSS